MIIKSTKIKDVKLIFPKFIKDKRGYFVETYNLCKFKNFFRGNFVQENMSLSLKKHTLRGLHFQKGKYAQDKLLSVRQGAIIDFIYDLRSKSKSFKKLLKIKIDEKSNFLIFIPKGCAHGFLTLKNNTIINYKVSDYYNKENDSGINFQGIILNTKKKYIISQKDKNLKFFNSNKKYF